METDNPGFSPADWLESAGLSPDYQLQPLAGGDINDTALLTTTCGQRFCLKRNSSAPGDFFHAEAAGLQALAAAKCLRVPQVHCSARTFILLEYLEPAARKDNYWHTLGSGLAEMHSQVQPYFGFHRDNYCGLTPQPNPATSDGYAFFGEHRLLYQARLARESGLLTANEAKQVEGLVARLPELVPEQAPALLHGDLWGGNIHTDAEGEPVLIDPAAHYGWPEAELAMTRLFGGFATAFYDSYAEQKSLDAGWRERADLYNLYHLLNHLNLFGGGYHAQVMRVVKQFS